MFRCTIPAAIPLLSLQTNIRLLAFARSRTFGSISRGLLKTSTLKHVPCRGCFHPGASSQVPLGGAQTLSGYGIVRKLLQYVWPRQNPALQRRVVIALSLLISAKLVNVCVPFLFKDVVNYYNDRAPEFLKLTMDTPSSTVFTVGISLILAYGLARATSAGLNELRNAVFAKVAQGSVRSIARNIFLHLHSLDLSFHLNRQTGALSKAIDRGTRGMSFVLNAMVFNIVPTIVEIGLVTAIFSSSLGSEFALTTAGCIGMYSAATLAITRWRTRFRHEMNKADNEAGNKAIDSLINYETVKYFNNEKFEADRYDLLLRDFEHASLKTTSSLALLNFVQNTIFTSGLIGVMALAANGVANGTLTVGDLVLANTLLFQLSIPLNFLGSVYREVRQGLVDMNTMFSLLDLKPKIFDKPGVGQLKVDGQATLTFENIVFGYRKDQPILNGLDLVIPPGQKIAIVGGSGSGKSTLIRLIYRLFDSESGVIRMNGQNIRDVSLSSLREQISVVPQDSVLFHDTIYYNIAYGRPTATREEVEAAARAADLHDAVLRMPRGYDTMVGERGLKLSGGEKQRVAIARAILKNCPFVIFDEATSSLDAITESNIMNALKSATVQKTSLFVAHRLSTIKDADTIYVLEAGRVAERGTHAELLTHGGVYAELWRSQHSSGGQVEKKKRKEEEDAPPLLVIEDPACCGNSSCNR